MTDPKDQRIDGGESESTAEGAEDLDDAALAAAAMGAEADVSAEGPYADEAEGDETEGEDLEGEEAEEAEEAEGEPRRAAAVAGAGAAALPERRLRPEERRAARLAARTEIPIDPALRIKDRASAIFVLACVAVFALIFLNGIVLGRGGLLTPISTAVPSIAVPSAVPSDSAAPATSGPTDTAAPPGSTAPSTAPSAGASPAAS